MPYQTLQSILDKALNHLQAAGIDQPVLDARWLIGHALGIGRLELMLQRDRILTQEEISNIEQLISRRAARESVARILGEREFWGLPFGLNEATLEPRPDSEILVEVALAGFGIRDSAFGSPRNLIPNPESLIPNPSILDLGTGTGCLLLALLHSMPMARGLGIDLSPRAIEQAQSNAERLQLQDRARFQVGDWLENLTEKFDLIISNPPYIAPDEIPSLMPEVREHDPHLALDGGTDGLAPYRYLIPQLSSFLKPNGFVVFEVGQGQAAAVTGLLQEAGFQNITTHQDLGGVERCVMATHLTDH